jgi:3-hydroxyisobutyrate dehydrogenase-like beta-hydroxyacid dehydrogenase
MMQKDLDIALEVGQELGVSLRTVELAKEMLEKAVEMGMGDEDFAVLFKVVEQLSTKNEESNG